MNQKLGVDPTNDEHQQLRERILETSMEILGEDGLGGLSLRRIAEESETSTQMIYTIFGGKDALLEDVYEEGSRRLVERFQSVTSDQSPILRLYEMGHEYRAYALDNEALYEALFSSSLSDTDIVKKTHVFDILREAIRDCFEADLLTLREPETITESFWAAAHGAIGLELSGYYDSEEDARKAYDEVIRAVFDGFRVDDPTDINP